ncbi:MAG: type II secretion system protein GspM [Pseudomonadota bacterium]
MNLTGLLGQSRQSFSEFWAVRGTRERALLSAGAMALVLGLIYLLLIAPALTGRERMNNDLPNLRQQVAQLQALSKQAATLSEKPATATAITRGSIEDALARNGMKPQSLQLTGDYTEVRLAAVSFAGTLAWLDDMQRTALLYVVDANIVALNQPDLVDATFTLRQARND